eukprot:c8300_g1_i1.p1 GENE.c8300_g1_i1~~c8300_g1_i1.p1  ORF type:complete len:234 (-),score=51.75 c8300_g1_i1:503-1204(-)
MGQGCSTSRKKVDAHVLATMVPNTECKRRINILNTLFSQRVKLFDNVEFHFATIPEQLPSFYVMSAKVHVTTKKVGEESEAATLRLLTMSQFHTLYLMLKELFFNSFVSFTPHAPPTQNNDEQEVLNADQGSVPSSSDCTSSSNHTHHDSPTPPARLSSSDLECSICLELGHVDTVLPCSHAFCSNCLSNWCATASTCPLCRAPADTDETFALFALPAPHEVRQSIIDMILAL